MAGGLYDAGFTKPDIGPGAAFIAAVLNQNKANERADQYANMERTAMVNSELRQSHEEKRKEEDEKHRRAVEAFAQLPALQRMAMKSVGMANANPYGVKFEEQSAPPPSIGNVDIMKAAGNSYGLHAADVLANPPAPPQTPTLGPGQEGPEVSPELEAQRFAPPEQPPVLGPEPPTGIEEAQSILAQPAKKTLFANVAGQRFELPQTSEHTPFGADYDSIYQGLLDAGEDPHKAMQVVAAEYKADQAEKGRANRLADTLDQRNTAREDQQAFIALQNKQYKNEPLTNAEREKLIALAGKFKVAASAPGFKQESANDRAMSLLERAGAGIRQTAQFAKLAASDKMNRTVMMNIANGTTPLQHRDAQISLARIFRQAQPTEGEMHLLYNNLGGTMDKWNQFVARMENGDLSAEQLRQLRISAHAVKKEHEEDLRRFQNVAKARLGPGGGFDLLPDQAQRLYESMGAELGLDNLPPLYQTEGGITVGSGKAPSVRPRGTKKTPLDNFESELDQALGNGR